MNRGIVYIASGERYIAEAMHSACSVARHNPEIPCVLIADRAVEAAGCFAEVRVAPMDHIRPKVEYLLSSPFEHTLYLDSDTEVIADLSDMFQVLERFDVALAHDFSRRRRTYSEAIPEYASIPYAFPEMNGGVLLYNRSPITRQFLERWRELYRRYRTATRGYDQATLRLALWQVPVRLHTLPVEYNVRSQGVRERVRKNARRGADFEHQMAPRILHWHGLNERRWWHRWSPKYRAYRY